MIRKKNTRSEIDKLEKIRQIALQLIALTSLNIIAFYYDGDLINLVLILDGGILGYNFKEAMRK